MCRHGENIYHRKDGRWEVRFPIGKRDNGTTKFKSVFGRTYNEAKAKKYRALMEWLRQHPSCDQPGVAVSFSDFATRWLEEEVLGTVKPSTYQTYLGTLKNQLLRFDVAGSARKALAAAIGEHTGAYPSYQAAPSFAYLIGDYTLDRTGTLAGPKNDYLIRALADDGYKTK